MSEPAIRPLRQNDPQIIGPYRLVHRLGAGGMGVVYAAVDDRGHRVAIKQVHPELAHDRQFRARFTREIALLGRVQGKYVTRVLNSDPDAAQPWLATEYIPGATLAQRVAETGPLTEQEVIGLAAGLGEALRCLHQVNVVHRDLKPSNVILAPTGPRLIDMGVARALDETSITRTGAVVGSPGWISPEEYRGDEVGPAADVYGWGLLVLYAATGRLPFGAGRPHVLAVRVLTEPPDVDGVPEPLLPIVTRALVKDPAGRPTVSEILEACGQAWRTSDASAEDVTRFLDRTWIMPLTDGVEWVAPKPARKFRLPAVALAAVVTLLGAGVTVAAAVSSTEASRDSQSTGAKAVASTPSAPQVRQTPVATPASGTPVVVAAPTPKAGTLTITPEGRAFLLPAGWKATHETGASGGMTCARPKEFEDCSYGGVIISYGVEPSEDFNLDDPSHIVGFFCSDENGGSVEERELRTNIKHEYQFRKYTLRCAGQQDLAAYSAYFPDGDNLIVAARVPKPDIDSVIESLDLDPAGD